ncbi:MAG TPA: Gfo/Idh/MocA family oxidoreductase [Candidatus Binatus sp.]|nr:Gfo/Idh/MocA family oxidoreductase [Candidatus Binatus sp.]
MKLPLSGQIRIGIMGAGLIGQAHSRMLRECADRTDGAVRVTAVADAVRASADGLASRWPGARAASDARDLIEDPNIDALYLCTPTRFHRDLFFSAARAGKHIFCEKPLAMTAAEAAEMATAARSAEVASQVGLVLRFSAVYTVIRARARAPEAGRLLAVTLRDDQDFPTRGAHASAWRNDPELTAGGTLIEHSVHDFDLMAWMFGPVTRLYCRTRNLNGAMGVEDLGVTDLEVADGAHAQLTSVWHRMIGRISNRRMEVFCENLYMACQHDMSGPIIVQRGDAAREEVIAEADVLARFAEIILAERPYLAPLRDQLANSYALEDASFIAALRGQCDVNPDISLGVEAQRMVEAAYESARLRLLIELKST